MFIWLIPMAPLLGALLNGTIAARYAKRESRANERVVAVIGCLAPLISFAVACLVFVHMLGLPPEQRVITQTLFPWIVAGNLYVEFGFLVDALSIVMVLVVTGVGTIIHFYSVGYMAKDPGFARYFAYLNLFMFSMLLLVMGKNLPLLFVGWEGVGLCSYLLIGFWYKDLINAAAGKKAFIVNRVGDFGFLLGIFLLFVTTSRMAQPTLDFIGLRALVSQNPEAFAATATATCLLLFLGATGKSAQIPLHVWLPDAMAGPTPVSALIHAATMVTAGVYMVARLSFLYLESPVAMAVVATVGAVTALFAATIGVCQRDIKKVLAYSTVSQLGYMFTAVGVGAFSAGIFHLVTHAFFKACLFLGAGSVIHAMSGEQDMFKMGALVRKLKMTMFTFVVAGLAIAGMPPLSGFFSKDEILYRVFTAHVGPPWLPGLLWAILLVGAGVTAFYILRAIFLTFFGERKYSEEAAHHLHESPAIMTVPLVLLAAGSIGAGFVGMPAVLGAVNHFEHFLEPSLGPVSQNIAEAMHHAVEAEGHVATHGSTAAELVLMVLSVLAGLAGIGVAHRLYIRKPLLPARISASFRGLYRLVYGKYFVDEAYEAVVVRPGFRLSDTFLFKVIDVWVIDGTVNAVGAAARLFGSAARLLQTGVVRTYALFFLLGILYLVYRLAQ